MRDDALTTYLDTIELDGQRYAVHVKMSYDGIEYVGRLWFSDEAWEDVGIPDRGAVPGRTRDEVITLARRLTPQDLALRYRRALAEKRRYVGLRQATNEILAKIRYLNQVALSMRAGLLDADGAAQELDLTERQLHEMVENLRKFAGVEGAAM